MLITIDPGDDSPLFEQIAASIRSNIIGGSIATGFRLPPANELSESLEVNRNTVLHAYQLLRDEGLVELRRGRGATITAKAERLGELSAAVTDLVTTARSLGVSADTLSRLIKEAAHD